MHTSTQSSATAALSEAHTPKMSEYTGEQFLALFHAGKVTRFDGYEGTITFKTGLVAHGTLHLKTLAESFIDVNAGDMATEVLRPTKYEPRSEKLTMPKIWIMHAPNG